MALVVFTKGLQASLVINPTHVICIHWASQTNAKNDDAWVIVTSDGMKHVVFGTLEEIVNFLNLGL